MQPSFSAIHDPYAEPASERHRQFKVYRDCRARIDAAAKPQTVVLARAPNSAPASAAPVFPLKDWVERQKKIPLPVSNIEPPAAPPPVERLPIPVKRLPIPVKDIQAACARFYDIGLADIVSGSREKPYVLPRQIAMFLARELSRCSMPEIGRRFGWRDHTTVMYAIKKIAGLVRSDQALAHDIADLELSLSGAS